MSVFNYEGPIEDINSGGPQAGPVSLTIHSAETKTSRNGNEYLSIDFRDDKDYSIKHSFFPKSTKDYPKKVLADFLIVCGFWDGSKVNLSNWSQLVGKSIVAICQLESYYWDGKDRTKRVPHSFYRAQDYRSGKEIASGAQESASFVRNKAYVETNPTLNSAKSQEENSDTEPF